MLIVAVLGMALLLSVRYARVISRQSMRTSNAVRVVGEIVAATSATEGSWLVVKLAQKFQYLTVCTQQGHRVLGSTFVVTTL